MFFTTGCHCKPNAFRLLSVCQFKYLESSGLRPPINYLTLFRLGKNKFVLLAVPTWKLCF